MVYIQNRRIKAATTTYNIYLLRIYENVNCAANHYYYYYTKIISEQ